ncbi:hypothetical protein DPEC_G00198180 [Dallia pectoralis]|uniref:Uncharacterized protein n=1 Tax=Dallia pectoralis TaxID=75939 RepID=A0ACC2G8L0_DALPE|nr:hypothetical protein DPEC_G00198180 [Dallia pectoralis]
MFSGDITLGSSWNSGPSFSTVTSTITAEAIPAICGLKSTLLDETTRHGGANGVALEHPPYSVTETQRYQLLQHEERRQGKDCGYRARRGSWKYTRQRLVWTRR